MWWSQGPEKKKKITDIPFLLSVCLNPLLSATRRRCMCLQRDFLMGGFLLAWFCLSRRLWTSVELKIFQYLIGIALVGMRRLGRAENCEARARTPWSARTFVAGAGETSDSSRSHFHCRCWGVTRLQEAGSFTRLGRHSGKGGANKRCLQTSGLQKRGMNWGTTKGKNKKHGK